MRLGAFLFFQLEHVAHVHEADDLVDGLLVDRNARVLLVDDQLAQLLERGVGRNGHDVGPRRHHFAHHLVAELHHRLDQLAVVFLDEAFFGAGRDQRFDVLGRGGLLRLRRGIVGESTSDWKNCSTATNGRAISAINAQQRDQRQQPSRRVRR